jgi:hypothetical protein
MISAILAKLFTSLFKVAGYTRFLKLAVICLDLGCCLFAGVNLVGLTLSERILLGVAPADQAVFISSLLIRALAAGALFCRVFEKQSRYSAYLVTILVYALSKYLVPGIPLVGQPIGLNMAAVGLGYTLVSLVSRTASGI